MKLLLSLLVVFSVIATAAEEPVSQVMIGVKDFKHFFTKQSDGKHKPYTESNTLKDYPANAGGFDIAITEPKVGYYISDLVLEGRTLKMDNYHAFATVKDMKVSKRAVVDTPVGRIDKEIFSWSSGFVEAKVEERAAVTYTFPADPIEFEIETEPTVTVKITNLKAYLDKILLEKAKDPRREGLEAQLDDATLDGATKSVAITKGLNGGGFLGLDAAVKTKLQGELAAKKGQMYQQFRNLLKKEVGKEEAIQKTLSTVLVQNLQGFPIQKCKGKLLLGEKAGDISYLIINRDDKPETFTLRLPTEKLKISANQSGWNLMLAAKLHEMNTKGFSSVVDKKEVVKAKDGYLIYPFQSEKEKQEWADAFGQITGTNIASAKLTYVRLPLTGNEKPQIILLPGRSGPDSIVLRTKIELMENETTVLGSAHVDPYFIRTENGPLTMSHLRIVRRREETGQARQANLTKLSTVQGGAKLLMMQFLLNQMIQQNTQKLDFGFTKYGSSTETFFSVTVQE